MRAADTNILVRLITRDSAAQVASAEHFVASGAWVPHIVLVETMWVLDAVYALGRQQIALAVEMLLSHHSLAIQDADVVAAALGQFRRHKGVGFSDCLSLEVARRAGHLPLGTFDRQFARLPDVQRL
jgi:predicted nucleic-acid-binding protein